MHRPHRTRLTASLMALQLGLTSCATLNEVPGETTEARVGTTRRSVPNGRTLVRPTLTSAQVNLETRLACDVVVVTAMRETTRTEYETPAGTTVYWLTGVASAVLGGVVLSRAAQADRLGEDPEVVKEMRGQGAGALISGALLAGVTTIDMMRATRTDEAHRTYEVTSGPLETDVACDGEELRGGSWVAIPRGADEVTVTAVGDGASRSATGRLARGGASQIDLLPLVAQGRFAEGASRPTSLVLALGGVTLGSVPAQPILRLHDAARRKELASVVAACEAPSRSTGCDALRRELEVNPAAAYAAELRATLETAKPRLDALRDSEAWAEARAEACAAPDDEDDCDGIEGYLARWPTGAYAAQARQTLTTGQAAMRKLEAQRRAEEAREAAEEAREAAEQARREAAAERERRRGGSGSSGQINETCARQCFADYCAENGLPCSFWHTEMPFAHAVVSARICKARCTW
jgi:hypothetical protein